MLLLCPCLVNGDRAKWRKYHFPKRRKPRHVPLLCSQIGRLQKASPSLFFLYYYYYYLFLYIIFYWNLKLMYNCLFKLIFSFSPSLFIISSTWLRLYLLKLLTYPFILYLNFNPIVSLSINYYHTYIYIYTNMNLAFFFLSTLI